MLGYVSLKTLELLVFASVLLVSYEMEKILLLSCEGNETSVSSFTDIQNVFLSFFHGGKFLTELNNVLLCCQLTTGKLEYYPMGFLMLTRTTM